MDISKAGQGIHYEREEAKQKPNKQRSTSDASVTKHSKQTSNRRKEIIIFLKNVFNRESPRSQAIKSKGRIKQKMSLKDLAFLHVEVPSIAELLRDPLRAQL